MAVIDWRRTLHTAENGSQEEQSTWKALSPTLGFCCVALNQLFLCDSSPLLLYLPFFLPILLREGRSRHLYEVKQQRSLYLSRDARLFP